MTVKELIDEIEHLYGRQPHMLVKRYINDALLDMSGKVRQYKAHPEIELLSGQRWYPISDLAISIDELRVKNSNGNYELVPYLDDNVKIKEDKVI